MPKIELPELRNPLRNTPGEFLMDPANRFAWVEFQLRQVILGSLDSIACPYCLSGVLLGVEKLYCDPMAETTSIVLERVETENVRRTDGSALYVSYLGTTRSALKQSSLDEALRREVVSNSCRNQRRQGE